MKMRKSRIFSLACCFSICILAVQIFILRTLLQKDTIVDPQDDRYVFVSRVLNLSFKHNVPLFLTDSKVLKRIENKTETKVNKCYLFCDSQTVLHLATIGPVSSQMQKSAFIEALEEEECKVIQYMGSDPVLLQHGLNSPVPLHFVVIRNHIVVHISIFYERPAKFWWVGGSHLSDKEQHELYNIGIKKYDLDIIQNPAAFDKVEIHSAAIENVKVFVPREYNMFLNYPADTRFVECNYTQAKLFFEKYGRDESDDAELFRSKAWKLFSKASSLLNNLKIPFWLSSGTCLGFFRECGFIPYSKDVDIGIWIKDYNPKIISAFSTNDLPLTHSFGKIEDSYELSFRDGDIKLDIFFFYEEDGYVWNGGTQARTGKKYKYMFPKFQLCWTEFLELKVRIPCQIEEYIKANYGEKWYEPIKVWDWKSSPSNVVPNGQWPLEEWSEVIQLLPLPEQT